MGELFNKLRSGDRIACAKAISAIENENPGSEELIESLFPFWGRAARIGVTGAPGTGKSSLVNHFAARIRKDGKTIGIIAVDPSSPFSGGALLGDRIRMSNVQLDRGVFIRSLATRGSLGGLAKAADDVALVFDAFGKDYVIFETVGVGQSEVDIAQSADTTILVLTPDAGDAVQTLKAGIMEIADIFVINKSDKPGADRVAANVRVLLDMEEKTKQPWCPPIVMTVSTDGKGIEELHGAVNAHRAYLEREGLIKTKREAQALRKIRMSVEAAMHARIFSGASADFVEEQKKAVAAGKCSPMAAAKLIFERCLNGEKSSGKRRRS